MLFEKTLRKSLLFFLFDFKQFSLKTNNNEGLKKFFQLWKTRVCCPHFLCCHFCKSAFFCFWFAWLAKGKEWTKKQKDQFNFFFAWFLFLITKWFCSQKKTICLLEALFSENTKKKKLSHLCTKQLLGCLFQKQKQLLDFCCS